LIVEGDPKKREFSILVAVIGKNNLEGFVGFTDCCEMEKTFNDVVMYTKVCKLSIKLAVSPLILCRINIKAIKVLNCLDKLT